jgi:hypothetical protein
MYTITGTIGLLTVAICLLIVSRKHRKAIESLHAASRAHTDSIDSLLEICDALSRRLNIQSERISNIR